MFDDFLSIRKLALKVVPMFVGIDLLPEKNTEIIKKNSSTTTNEKIEIKPIDYYYSNAIARASKTMSDCRNVIYKNKKDGTNN